MAAPHSRYEPFSYPAGGGFTCLASRYLP